MDLAGDRPKRAVDLRAAKPKSKFCIPEFRSLGGTVLSISACDGDDMTIPSTELPTVSKLVVDVFRLECLECL